MNKTEEWYFEQLKERMRSGEFCKVEYESITLRLAKNTTYTPDFYCLRSDGTIEFHETKGTWRGRGQDNARTKLKVAAALHPEFKFLAVVIKNYKIHSIEEM